MINHKGIVVASHNGLSVIDCEQCKYAHLDPLPDKKEREAYYGDDDQFYALGGDAWFGKEWEEHTQGYWEPYYDYNLNLLDFPVSLIDWGCGAGWFVQYCWTIYGIKAWGIEPSVKARQVLPSDRIESSYDKLTNHEKWHSSLPIQASRAALLLEHLPDPLTQLRQMKLVAHSKIMVVVPNEFNPLQKKIGRDWFVNKDHCNYFTPQGLRNLFEQAGLNVTIESATFPMELFAMMGFDYIDNEEIGKKCHLARLKFEKVLGLRAFKLYYYLYRWFGWGRELIFIGKSK